MRRVLPAAAFREWWAKFLPELPAALLNPAIVADRADPKIVHLDGLNLSRAACLWSIAPAFPEADPLRKILTDAAEPALSESQLVEIQSRAERSMTTIHTIQFNRGEATNDGGWIRDLAEMNRGTYRYVDILSLSPQ